MQATVDKPKKMPASPRKSSAASKKKASSVHTDTAKDVVLGRTKRKRVVKHVDAADKQNEKGWAAGVIEDEILGKYVARYAEARRKGLQAERNLLQTIYNDFFFCVPWNLKKGEQPQRPLPLWKPESVVDDSQLSDEENTQKMAFMKKMKPKIRRWMVYRADTAHSSTNNPGDDIWNVLLAKATNIHPPNKARQGYQQWMHERYADDIGPTVQREWLAKHDGETPTTSPGPGFQATVARKLFKELPEDVQQDYKDRAKAEAAAKRAAYREKLENWPGQTPHDRQNAVDNLGRFLRRIMKGISDATGLHVFFMAGGPIPQYGGSLRTVHVAYGTNRASAPVSFPNWDKDRFGGVVTLMKEYLKTAFSAEECAAAALPRGEQVTPPPLPSQQTNIGVGEHADPSAPLDFAPVDDGVTAGAGGNGRVTFVFDSDDDDDEDDEDDDDDDEDKEETEAERNERELVQARKYMAQREENIACNKALLISLGLGDPIQGKPVQPKKPRASKSKKDESKTSESATRRTTRASAAAGAASAPAPPPVQLTLPTAAPSAAAASAVLAAGPAAASSEPTRSSASPPSPRPLSPRPLSPSPRPPSPSPRPPSPSNPSSSSAGSVVAPVPVPAPDMEIDSESLLAGGKDEDPMDVDTEKSADPQILAMKTVVGEEAGWFSNVLDEVSGEALGESFVGLVQQLVDLEREYGWRNGMGRLATASRPRQVGDWIQNYRKATPAKCGIPDLSAFTSKWWAWWHANQPRWRMYDERDRPLRSSEAPPDDAQWDKLVVPGQNGMTSFVAGLYWWGCKEKEAGVGSADWNEAVLDVTWVLRGLKVQSKHCGHGAAATSLNIPPPKPASGTCICNPICTQT
ncbi:hypothetical protein C8F01DRAFT_1319600 [Mycena amicta]|nr:hypothetical protein C8F01DRAFT_1319600 [Mycena amicta]